MQTSKKLVEIRPLEIPRWHGLTKQESIAQPLTIRVLYDHETGGYATGLTEEETIEYSRKLGVDLNNTFNPMKAHPYWDSSAAKIKLPNYSIFLDPSIPLEYVRIKNLKQSHQVANSMKEWNEGKYPEATHVIFDELEEVDIKATKAQRKSECYILADKLSPETKENILAVISEKAVKGRSSNFIAVQLEEIIENNPTEFLKYAKMGTEELGIRSLLTESIYKNVLTKEGMAIYYMNDRIANSYEDAVTYFLDPQNQQLKVSLLEKLI